MTPKRLLIGLVALIMVATAACSSGTKSESSTTDTTTASTTDEAGGGSSTDDTTDEAMVEETPEATTDEAMADDTTDEAMTDESTEDTAEDTTDEAMTDESSEEDAAADAGSESAGGDFVAKDCTTDGLTELKVVTVGIYTDATLDLATSQCLFADNGVNVSYTVVPNPPAAIAALSGGEADIAYSPSIPIVRAFDAGAPMRVVASADGYTQEGIDKYGAKLDDTAVYTVEPITSAKDLEGKSVAVPARGAQLEVTTAWAVKADGGDPSKVNFVVLDFPNMIDAAKAGEVDAIALVSPFTLQADQAGLANTGITAVDFFGAGSVGMWATSESIATEKADALKGFQTGIYAADELANANPEGFWKVASDVTGVPYDDYVANDIDYYFPTTVTTEDLTKVADKLQQLGFLENDPDLAPVIIN